MFNKSCYSSCCCYCCCSMKRFKVLPGNLPINNRWNNQHEIFKKYSNSLAHPPLFFSVSMLLSLALSVGGSRWCCCRFVTSCGAFDLIYLEFAFLAPSAVAPQPPLPFNRLDPLLEFGSSLQLAFLNMLHTFVRCKAWSECENMGRGVTLFRIPVNISITFR